MAAVRSESISLVIRDYQVGIEDWSYSALVQELHRWAEIFDVEFKLELPSYPVIRFAPLRNAYATYQAARGELGTRDNITLNSNELTLGMAQILSTLLHELLHLWQEHRGHPSLTNHHNAEFRAQAAACGLIVGKSGCHSGYTSEFTELMRRHGLSIEPLEAELSAAGARLWGTSKRPLKMAKWSCHCTRVRCAIALDAWCRRCGEAFVLGEHVVKEKRK